MPLPWMINAVDSVLICVSIVALMICFESTHGGVSVYALFVWVARLDVS
jgi:hypothetical protein